MDILIDLVLLLIALLAVVGGWRRGALMTAAALAGIVAGAWLTGVVAPPVVDWLATQGWSSPLQRTLAAAAVLILCIALA
jgi:uncharacterized membrane protein required for colicin V production